MTSFSFAGASGCTKRRGEKEVICSSESSVDLLSSINNRFPKRSTHSRACNAPSNLSSIREDSSVVKRLSSGDVFLRELCPGTRALGRWQEESGQTSALASQAPASKQDYLDCDSQPVHCSFTEARQSEVKAGSPPSKRPNSPARTRHSRLIHHIQPSRKSRLMAHWTEFRWIL